MEVLKTDYGIGNYDWGLLKRGVGCFLGWIKEGLGREIFWG